MSTIYSNQIEIASDIISKFGNQEIRTVLVHGHPQVGKTGVIASLISQYSSEFNVPLDNIFVITGLSSGDWLAQTKSRLPGVKNVFHRPNAELFNSRLRDKRDVLVIVDEAHLGLRPRHSMGKVLVDNGFSSVDAMRERGARICEISATLDGLARVAQTEKWRAHSAMIQIVPPDAYLSPQRMVKQGRLFAAKNLQVQGVAEEYRAELEARFGLEPLYHIIRIPSARGDRDGRYMRRLMEVFQGGDYKTIDASKHDSSHLHKVLSRAPTAPTLVYIKESLRCAVTIDKTYIGSVYERIGRVIGGRETTKVDNDSSIVQGLFGRLLGYDDNGRAICYTNIKSIANYLELTKTFDPEVKWLSATTTIRGKGFRNTYKTN